MADEAAPAEKPAKGEKSGIPLVPLILVMLLIPVITLVLTEFVIIPRLQSSVGASGSSDHADASDHGSSSGGGHSTSSDGGDSHGGGGHGSSSSDHGEDSGGGGVGYEFKEVICNLAGTMGTRFLKVSFEVEGSDPDLPNMIRSKKPRVQDAVITTLSSKTIQDIEVPGGRNALRVALITAINQAIGFAAVEELYFTEFIIQ